MLCLTLLSLYFVGPNWLHCVVSQYRFFRPTQSLSPVIVLCCDVPCALLQFTHKQKERNKEPPHAPSPSLGADAARVRVTWWFPGQGSVRKSWHSAAPIILQVFLPRTAAPSLAHAALSKGPVKVEKTARWPSKETSWGISYWKFLGILNTVALGCILFS